MPQPADGSKHKALFGLWEHGHILRDRPHLCLYFWTSVPVAHDYIHLQALYACLS